MKTKEVWIDIDTAPPEEMQMAFAQERNRILALLCQVKNDLDHYNSYKNKDGVPLVYVFDFSDDIAEYVASGYDKSFLSGNPKRVQKLSIVKTDRGQGPDLA